MAFATSQGRDREKHEGRVPALLEAVLLSAGDHEDVPRLQRDPFFPDDEDPAARGHVDLVLPVVAVDARPPALLDPDLVECGFLRAVLLAHELLHQDAVGADLPEPHGLQGADVRPVHPTRESGSPDKRFARVSPRSASRACPGRGTSPRRPRTPRSPRPRSCDPPARRPRGACTPSSLRSPSGWGARPGSSPASPGRTPRRGRPARDPPGPP